MINMTGSLNLQELDTNLVDVNLFLINSLLLKFYRNMFNPTTAYLIKLRFRIRLGINT